MINKKGLTDKEIQILIDNEKLRRHLQDAYVVAKIEHDISNVFFNTLKSAKDKKRRSKSRR